MTDLMIGPLVKTKTVTMYAHGQRKINARVVFHSCDVLVLLKQHNNGTKEIENPNKGNKASMPENEFDEEEVLSE